MTAIKVRNRMKLPSDFAEKVVKLEFQVDRGTDLDKGMVKALIDIYTLAIEYYNCQSDIVNQ